MELTTNDPIVSLLFLFNRVYFPRANNIPKEWLGLQLQELASTLSTANLQTGETLFSFFQGPSTGPTERKWDATIWEFHVALRKNKRETVPPEPLCGQSDSSNLTAITPSKALSKNKLTAA